MQTLYATFTRNFIIQLRAYPKDFFIGNLLTGIYTAISAWLMYHRMFGGRLNPAFLTYAGTADYMSYVATGAVVYLFCVRTCLNVSRSLITELRTGTLESLMLAPFSRIQYFLGNMLQQTVTTGAESLCLLAAFWFFGLRAPGLSVSGLILATVAALTAFFSVSMLLACVMLYTRDTYISQNTLFALLFLLCGITFPAEYLPDMVQRVSEAIPVTWAVRMIREAVLQGVPAKLMMTELVRLLIPSGVACVAGFVLLGRTERRALEKLGA